MSNLDALLPDDFDDLDQDEYHLALRIRALRLQRSRGNTRRRMASREQDSSESESGPGVGEANGKVQLTPAGNGTPNEDDKAEQLVKLDPSEIGKFYACLYKPLSL
jgi:hypothetical protein